MSAGRAAGNGAAEHIETGLPMQVLHGDPTPEELAAAIAVVTESYHREAATAIAEDDTRLSAWQISARALREPLRRELGWGR